MTRIKLLQPHTLNGVTFTIGRILDVPDATAQFLIKGKRAEASADGPKTKEKKNGKGAVPPS